MIVHRHASKNGAHIDRLPNEKQWCLAIAFMEVAPMGKAPFVYSYVQTRLMGQYNGKSPFSLVHVLKPLITAIRAITWPLQVQGWGSRTNCINMYVGFFLVCCVLGNKQKTNLKALSELGRQPCSF